MRTRYCPDWPFPAYRYVPGLSPHPHKAGNAPTQLKKAKALTEDNWHTNQYYLFGIDLYHYGYFWEAHEAWEALWHLTTKNDETGQFLQGLIQNSAAQLKVHLGEWHGARNLSEEAYRRLGSIRKETLFGLNLKELLKQMHQHYTLLWQGGEGVKEPMPLLLLKPPVD